jgi:hypothetical protein
MQFPIGKSHGNPVLVEKSEVEKLKEMLFFHGQILTISRRVRALSSPSRVQMKALTLVRATTISGSANEIWGHPAHDFSRCGERKRIEHEILFWSLIRGKHLL